MESGLIFRDETEVVGGVGDGGINFTPAAISSSSMSTRFLFASPFFLLRLSLARLSCSFTRHSPPSLPPTSSSSSWSSSSSIPTTTNLDRSTNTSKRSFKHPFPYAVATTCASRAPLVSFPINCERILTRPFPASPFKATATPRPSSSERTPFPFFLALLFSSSPSSLVSSSFALFVVLVVVARNPFGRAAVLSFFTKKTVRNVSSSVKGVFDHASRRIVAPPKRRQQTFVGATTHTSASCVFVAIPFVAGDDDAIL